MIGVSIDALIAERRLSETDYYFVFCLKSYRQENSCYGNQDYQVNDRVTA